MKKQYSALYLVILVALTTFLYAIPTIEAATVYTIDAIPEDAIRLRILANSNSQADQDVKIEIRNAVVDYINTWSEGLDSKQDAEKLIEEKLPEIEGIVKSILLENGVKETVKVEYKPTDFPTKIYGDIVYPAGIYDAVKISIGAAEGDNWWCVLYPPLCFLNTNQSSDDKVEEPTKEQSEQQSEEKKAAETEEVKSLTKEFFENIF